MTLRQAERITGLTVVKVNNADDFIDLGYWFVALDKEQNEVFKSAFFKESDAAAWIVDWNYNRVGWIVLKQQKYRCAKCGQRKPLSRHHKKLRSHGRVDSVDNIQWLCEGCHAGEHGPKKGK